MASDGISVSISGVDKIIKRVQQVTQLQIKAISEAISESSLNIEGNAKRRCPVKYGRLRASIRTRFTPSNGQLIAGEVFTDIKYAPYIEFGTGTYNAQGRKTPWVYKDENGKFHKTHGMRARPFLYPAFDQESKNLIRNIRAILSSEI